tara:strand:+ start:1556 stop:2221 length:666 start_codon:yes stop_codon:yes gene_type:complete
MKQPIKVVMLPTKDNVKASICQGADRRLYYSYSHPENDMYRNHYLYITVSQDREPIKEGDWYYNSDTNNIYNSRVGVKVTSKASYKIIATTDLKLFTRTSFLEDISNTTVSLKSKLPQLQQSFLKEFVANPEGEYEVEYEKDRFIHIAGAFGGKIKVGLKLNQDNTVNITSVEEKMYSREEYEAKIKSITAKEIREAKSIQHTFGHNTFGESLLYILNSLD